MKRLMLVLMVAALATASQAATIAHWDFEGAALGPFDPDGGGNDGVSSAEGITMYGWDGYWGPGVVAQASGNQVMQNLDHHQDGYVYSTGVGDPAQALIDFSSPTWTIEATFILDSDGTGDIGGWNTLIGRDSAGPLGGSASTLYF